MALQVLERSYRQSRLCHADKAARLPDEDGGPNKTYAESYKNCSGRRLNVGKINRAHALRAEKQAMTSLQELQDEILGLEAQLHGKRLEMAMAQGNRSEAQQHQNAIHVATKARRDFRLMVAEQGGENYFSAAGEADRLALQGAAG